LWEDVHDLLGPEGVKRTFNGVALYISGRGIGGDDFDIKYPLKQFLD